MNKNRIRLTESQLHNLIKKSVKSFINEGGHLTWKDDDGRMHTNSQDNWYGIEGATFVSHGEWSDGEIYFDYEGEQYVINANDAEEWLWNDFKEYCEENNLNPDEHSDDEIWYNFARNEGYDVLLNLGPYNESYEMNESKKRKVRLTESQLHRVIKESVKRLLKENSGGRRAYADNTYKYKFIEKYVNPLYQEIEQGIEQGDIQILAKCYQEITNLITNDEIKYQGLFVDLLDELREKRNILTNEMVRIVKSNV